MYNSYFRKVPYKGGYFVHLSVNSQLIRTRVVGTNSFRNSVLQSTSEIRTKHIVGRNTKWKEVT